MSRVLVLVTVILAALLTAPVWAAPTESRINGISPAVADRGELVTITGQGFGANNLRVTLAGEPVEVVSATGSRATIRVPELAPFGDLLVEARNPGGHVGRIGLHVRFDGQTEAVVDEAAAVSVPLGSEGGTIGVAGMTLAIPAGAVPEGTTITATPLLSLRGAPFGAAPVGVKLEPSGLVLLRPATLIVPKPKGAGTIVGFGFNNDGNGFHLVPHTAAGDTVELRVWHFSGAGATTVSAAELSAVLGYLPTPAHELAEQRIAAAVASEATGGPPPAQEIFDALVAWRTSSVSRGLDLARTDARLDYFELAFGEWLAWRSYAQEYDGLFEAVQRSFVVTATGIDRAVATEAAAAVARVLLPRCTGPTIPLSALRDVIRLASGVNLDALPTNEEGAEDGSGRSLPDGRNLPTSCVDVEIVGVQRPAALARNRNNRIVARAQTVFWKGEPSGTVPLRYRIAETTAAPVPLASGTSSNGTFETTVDPGTAGTRRLEVTVELDGSDTVLRTFFDQTAFFVPVRERLELQALTPTTIAAGGSVSVRVRVAGDGMVGAVVPLTVGGPGAIAPASVTTDTAGEATALYSVPADTMVTAASVDARLADGSTATVPITINTLVAVSVSPTTATLSPGQSINLTASVTGAFVTAVTWTASGGDVTTTGGNTARYVAGTTAGTFSVTATSIADPSKRATATVTILSGPRGVTKTRSRGVATAGVVNANDGGRCGFRDSPAGATAWSDSFSCNGFYTDGTISGTVSATAAAAFTETFEAGELVGVVATGIGGGTELGLAIGSAQGTYILEFRVTRPTRTRVRADVTGIFGSDMVFSLFGPGVNVFTRDEVAYDEVLTLAPGNYFVQMVGGGVHAGAFFSLQMEFGV